MTRSIKISDITRKWYEHRKHDMNVSSTLTPSNMSAHPLLIIILNCRWKKIEVKKSIYYVMRDSKWQTTTDPFVKKISTRSSNPNWSVSERSQQARQGTKTHLNPTDMNWYRWLHRRKIGGDSFLSSNNPPISIPSTLSRKGHLKILPYNLQHWYTARNDLVSMKCL